MPNHLHRISWSVGALRGPQDHTLPTPTTGRTACVPTEGTAFPGIVHCRFQGVGHCGLLLCNRKEGFAESVAVYGPERRPCIVFNGSGRNERYLLPNGKKDTAHGVADTWADCKGSCWALRLPPKKDTTPVIKIPFDSTYPLLYHLKEWRQNEKGTSRITHNPFFGRQ
jgi:hypothetical protein